MASIRGGVFTRADARACGYADVDIDALLRSGRWPVVRSERDVDQLLVAQVEGFAGHVVRDAPPWAHCRVDGGGTNQPTHQDPDAENPYRYPEAP